MTLYARATIQIGLNFCKNLAQPAYFTEAREMPIILGALESFGQVFRSNFRSNFNESISQCPNNK
jgi:hypothetical protein